MWTYQGKEITSVEQMPEDAIGFIYIIYNLTKNRAYIGRKNIFAVNTVRLTKKELQARVDKRRSKKKTVVKESNWLSYTGSCKTLNEDIKAGDVIEKQILEFAFSKRHINYLENKYLFQYAVLETEDFYNDNIGGRFFKGNIE